MTGHDFLSCVAAALICISWVQESSGLVRHCDSDTDEVREKTLQHYPGMKEWLQNESLITNGRLGTLHFVNWQDKVLTLKTKSKTECLWKMRSFIDREQKKFNSKFYRSFELNADPVNPRQYYRIISCETQDCVQYFNIFTRPITKPDFPVQVYFGYSKEITCTLEIMEDQETNFSLAYHNPPYQFEWTGPKDCPRKHWDSTSEKECMRYRSQDKNCPSTANGCSFKIDSSYVSTSNLPGQYKSTQIKINHNKVKNLKSEISTVLKIDSASQDHSGTWRCIVYDNFHVSSHPDDIAFLSEQGIVQRGIVEIHCKDITFAIGLPLGLTFIMIIWIIFCIACCPQCTDYQESETASKTKHDLNHTEILKNPAASSVVSLSDIPPAPPVISLPQIEDSETSLSIKSSVISVKRLSKHSFRKNTNTTPGHKKVKESKK